MKWWQIENCITLFGIVILILGLYAMGAGGHSFWALLLLLNINYQSNKKWTSHDKYK